MRRSRRPSRKEMSCPRCGEAAREGWAFCPDCGAPAGECDLCREYARKGYGYCGKCGRPLAQRPERRGDSHALSKAVFVAAPAIIALLIIEGLSLYWWAGDVFSWIPGHELKMYLLLPQMVSIGTLGNGALQAYWIFLIAAITASGIVLAYQSRTIVTERNGPDLVGKVERTPLFWLSLMFSAYLALVIIVAAIQGAIGYVITAPDGLPLGTEPEAFLSYANAAVWEEIASRLVPIGIPMVVVAGLSGRKDFLRYLLGGFGITKVGIVLIILSATIFGLAHLDSWGWAKVIPMIIGGLMMSYLYVRFGIHVSIIFHFITDFSGIALAVVGEQIFSFIFILIVVIGFISVAALAKYLKDGIPKIGNMPTWVAEDEDQTDDSSRSNLG